MGTWQHAVRCTVRVYARCAVYGKLKGSNLRQELCACMAAMGTMFDHKCKPLFNYGTGYRNTIKWSNSGRYVALCGFGNLPGDIGARCLRHFASTRGTRLPPAGDFSRCCMD